MKSVHRVLCLLIFSGILAANAQPCTPQGDGTTYGSNDIWIGYVYDNADFTNYQGYVNEGTAGNPAFNQTFGGGNVNYPTNGCPVNTESFSIRYKLRKTFTSGNYELTAGGDDGYRLSIDGGVTWIINRWVDQGYNTISNIVALNGTYDLVLEFYENGGGNQVSFSVQTACLGTGNPTTYGSGDIWNGYVYDGTNFSVYLGDVTAGSAGNPNFDINFGGSNVMYNTSTCPVQTETFSVRYRLRKTFANGNYIFLLGGDDGFRLSLDGGNTWALNRWWDQSYTTASYAATLSGTYDMVIEFYENGGDNRISFDMTSSLLPVRLLNFTGTVEQNKNRLLWNIAPDSNPDYFEIEHSLSGRDFRVIDRVSRQQAASRFEYFHHPAPSGISYYRLKIHDTEGNITYSPIISLTGAMPVKTKIFPTIIQHRTMYVQAGKNLENVTLAAVDMNGRQIILPQLRSIAAGQTVNVPLPGSIVPGSYIVHIRSATGTEATTTVIVQ